MKLIDPNKPRRDAERRILNKNGWLAVEAVKPNGSFLWRWIHPKFKKAHSRKEALQITRAGRVS